MEEEIGLIYYNSKTIKNLLSKCKGVLKNQKNFSKSID